MTTTKPGDTEDTRNVHLEDTVENWEKREGYLARLVIGWTGAATSSTQLTRDELQAVVNDAARKYDIHAECICRDDDWEPDCPSHGTVTGIGPGYCTTTQRDGYGEPWACFRRLNHKGYCGFQRTTSLPEDHPERGRA